MANSQHTAFSYVSRHCEKIIVTANIVQVAPILIAATLKRNAYAKTEDLKSFDLNVLLAKMLARYDHQSLVKEIKDADDCNVPAQSCASENKDYLNPILAGFGVASIRLATAARMIEQYIQTPAYDCDPLELVKYRYDYPKLISDLMDRSCLTSLMIAALMTREAQDYFLTPCYNVQGEALHLSVFEWNKLSQAERSGLIVSYFSAATQSPVEKQDPRKPENCFY